MLPSGVDLFAVGPLACEAARRALRSSEEESVYDAITGAEAESLPESLHGKALGLLKLLQQPLPEAAPTPLRTVAWQDKQLWTALGAWSEQRHTWAAQLKLSVTVLDGDEQPPGYVSPYPEFFQELGELARQTAAMLENYRSEPHAEVAGQEILDVLAQSEDLIKRAEAGEPYERGVLESMLQPLRHLHGTYCRRTAARDQTDQREWLRGAGTLERLARRWIEGENISAIDRELIRIWTTPKGADALKLLPEFADTCDRLARIARKQLDGQPLDADDARFIQYYGQTLARFQFYDDHAWLFPKDDFPLVTPVVVSPITGQILYAGLSRPEALYVILDVDGDPVLHRGAVLSYREFPRPLSEPVDDDSWTQDVKAGKAPPPPAFTSSFR